MNVCKSNTFVREGGPMLLMGTYYLLYEYPPKKRVSITCLIALHGYISLPKWHFTAQAMTKLTVRMSYQKL